MSRRTVLTGIIALSAFGLTAGLTASLGVSSDQLGAGTSTVAACDPVGTGGVDVSYGVTAATNTVASVTLDNVAWACEGQTATITLMGGTTVLDSTQGTLTLDATDGTGGEVLTFTAGTANAADVTSVSVVITGAENTA